MEWIWYRDHGKGGYTMFITPISKLTTISELSQSVPAIATTENSVSIPFAEMFQDAINNVVTTQAQSHQDAYDLALGKTDDLHTIMINSEKAATAIELTVQLTSKAVSAYNEIMRMQV